MKTYSQLLCGLLGGILCWGQSICSAQTPSWSIHDLGTLESTRSYGLAINQHGQVAGYRWGAEGARAFLFGFGGFTDLGALVGTNSYATSLNTFGDVAGFFEGTEGPRAFFQRHGHATVVGELAPFNHIALGLNDAGWIVGHVALDGADRAFLFDGQGVHDLETMGGSNSYAYAVNQHGVIAGASLTTDGVLTAGTWYNGAWTELKAFGGTMGGTLCEARAINDAGSVAGWGLHEGRREAFWWNGEAAFWLGPPGAESSAALALNQSNHVVGMAIEPGGVSRAVLWQGERMQVLDNLLPPGSGWELREARGINDRGQIVGWGFVGGSIHAFLLSPRQARPSRARMAENRFLLESGSSSPVTNSPLADAHVRDGANTNVNFGTATLMELQTSATAGNNRDVYLKFVAGNGPGPLGSARLRLFASLSGNGSVTTTIYAVADTNWSETGIRWTNKPALGAALTNQVFNVKSGASYEIDVTSYVRSEVDAGRNVITLALHEQANTTLLASVSSRENATVANRPVLILNTNTPPTVSITSPANNTVAIAPTNLVINATASDSDGAVTNVEFYADSLFLGRDTNSPFSITWTNALLGTFALTARATDDLGCTTTSAIVNVTISVSLNPVADAYVTSASPTANFGSATSLRVQTNGATGPTQDAYLRFDLSTVSNISSAKLRIFASLSGNGSGSGTWYSVADTTWNEAAITWNNKPDRSNALNHLLVTSTTATWFTNDITSFVQGEKAVGRDLLSLALHSQTNSNRYIQFNSREAASSKAELIVAVTNQAPTVAITNPTPGTLYVAPVNILVQATASDSDGSIQQIEFFDGAASLGSDSLPPFEVTINNAASGAHGFTAHAMDNLGLLRTSAVVTVTVDIRPTVAITSPAAGANFPAYPTNLTLAASAADSDGTVSQVEFFTNGVLFATDNSSPFSVVWNNVPGGINVVAARATDNLGVVSDWAFSPITVGRPPIVTLTSPSGGSVFSTLDAISMSATASDPDGVVVVVEFYSGSTKVGEDNTAPYSMSWSNAPAGVASLSAVAIDDFGLRTTSAVAQVTIQFTATAHLRMWLKAGAVTGVSSGNPVALWPDSGNTGNNVTQSTAGLQPLWFTNVVNGQPTVRFDGTSNMLNGAMAMATNNFTVLVVARPTDSHEIDKEKGFDESGDGGGSGQRYVVGEMRLDAQAFGGPNGLAGLSFGTNGVSVYEYQRGGSGPDVAPAQAVHVGDSGPGFAIVSAIYTDRIPRIYVAGGLARVGVPSVRPTVFAPGQVGGATYSVLSNYFAGDVAEVLLFDEALTAEAREAIERYLNEKYAIVTTTPGMPSNVTAFAISPSQISLAWSASQDSIAGYRIERRSSTVSPWQIVATVPRTVTGWLDQGLPSGTWQQYRVRAFNLFGDSGYANLASATTLSSGAPMPTAELGLWLRADAEVHSDAAGAVNIWSDQGPASNDALQFTVVSQPVRLAPTTGVPWVRFDGTNSFLAVRGWTATNEFSVYVVARTALGHEIDIESQTGSAGVTGQRYVVGDINEPTRNGSPPYYTVGASALSLGTNGVSYYEYQKNFIGLAAFPPLAVSTNSIGSNWVFLGAVYSNRVVRLYQDGRLARVGLPSLRPLAIAPSILGGIDPYRFEGDIAEVLIFRRNLRAEEQEAVGRYLIQKYNLNGTAPSAPSSILATGRSSSELGLTWTAGSVNESSFVVERKLGVGGTYVPVGVAPGGVTTWTDSGLSPTGQYYYRVKAVNYWGPSAYSSEISPPTALITSPLNISILATGVVISITALVTDADGTIANVEFFDFATSLGTDSTSPYNLTWSTTNAGAHRLVIKVTDNQGHTRLSAPVNLLGALDRDGDGISDLDEVRLGLDPTLADTDGDGVPDGTDAFPLDPTRWLPPEPTPGDNVPPDIILDEPEDAELLP